MDIIPRQAYSIISLRWLQAWALGYWLVNGLKKSRGDKQKQVYN